MNNDVDKMFWRQNYKNKFKKEDSVRLSLTMRCKCSHTVVMPVQIDKLTCKHCGRKILNKSKEHFMYKLRKMREKNEKN